MTLVDAGPSGGPRVGAPRAYPTVSVVIPTIGRPELVTAVASALAQTVPPLEVIVVSDRSVGADAVRRPSDDPRVRHVLSDARPGSAVATRTSGARQARGELVAHLDDDDEWLPTKLAEQLARYVAERERVRYPLVTSLQIDVDPDGRPIGAPRRPWHNPLRDDLGDSLFVRRRVFGRPTMIGSSSMLFDRRLLDVEPLDVGLELHDDWAWMLRVDRRPDAHVSIVERPLLRYRVNPPGTSVGTAEGARRSLATARTMQLSRRALGDFGFQVSAALAVAQGDRRTALRIAREVRREGSPGVPALCWLALMLAVPRRVVPALHRAHRALTARRR